MHNDQIVAQDLQDEKIIYPEFKKLKESHLQHASSKPPKGGTVSNFFVRWWLGAPDGLPEGGMLAKCSRLLVSATVSGDPNIIQIAYDVSLLGRHMS
ncbi:Oviduct-Specific Glycoprotein [Manis pentadactyla]|nr:Oviduct-Specific Glycoprotein [Manis pentadactyla]